MPGVRSLGEERQEHRRSIVLRPRKRNVGFALFAAEPTARI